MAEEKKEKKENGLAAKVRGLEKKLSQTIKALENQFGIDIDRDGKVGRASITLIGVMLIGSVIACLGADVIMKRYVAGEGDSPVIELEADDGDDTADSFKIRMGSDGVADFAIGDTDVVRVSSGGAIQIEQTTVNVTNGQAVTLTAGINYLNGISGTNGAINTITLARPSGGESVYLVNLLTATNRIAVGASGSWNSTAIDLSAGEAAYAVGFSDIDGSGTNAWRGAEF